MLFSVCMDDRLVAALAVVGCLSLLYDVQRPVTLAQSALTQYTNIIGLQPMFLHFCFVRQSIVDMAYSAICD